MGLHVSSLAYLYFCHMGPLHFWLAFNLVKTGKKGPAQLLRIWPVRAQLGHLLLTWEIL